MAEDRTAGTSVHLLTNPVRDYPWGGTAFIPHLLGRTPDGSPQAEMWIGAHPSDPSSLGDGEDLLTLIEQEPLRVLGQEVLERFGPRLPYLCKVLSAGAPLSLQVHPDTAQARRGYAAEEGAGIAPADPARSYGDPHGKPELLLALTPFEAVSGVRPLAATRRLLGALVVEHPRWGPLVRCLGADADEDAGADADADADADEDAGAAGAVRAYLAAVLGGEDWVPGLVDAVARACAGVSSVETRTIADLAERYPGDAGVLVALLLNRVSLRPGEAMFLAPGGLHAYLHGDGVEVMGASDNVLRAGLTGKHVDGAEVLEVADLRPGEASIVRPATVGGTSTFRVPTPEFEVSTRTLAGVRVSDVPPAGPRVVLVLQGHVEVHLLDDIPAVLHRGQSALVEHAAGPVSLGGHGLAVLVSVPQDTSHGQPNRIAASS